MSDRETRKANVVEALNKARSMELHAIHQYMNQHYNLDDMDYGELAANMKLIAIDEMRHCEMFAERIKELLPKLPGRWSRGRKSKRFIAATATVKTTPSSCTTSFAKSVWTTAIS